MGIATTLRAGPLGQRVLESIGGTPVVHLAAIGREVPRVTLLAKAEWYNPGGSVKDRPALRMIAEAEATGCLRPDMTILDATSGNTGIAYAMIGAVKGYRVTLAVPSNVSPERLAILRAYGAELVLTDPLEGTDGAIREARRLYAEDPQRYCYVDQYNNGDNWRAHYTTTGPEIWAQTRGAVTHFVAGVGTSGTFIGTSRYLKHRNPAVEVVAAQPDAALHGLEGWKHMPSSLVPGIYDAAVADRTVHVSTESAYAMVRRIALEEGWLVGPSGGANVVATLEVARSLPSGVVVTVLPDAGTKYLSDACWSSGGNEQMSRAADRGWLAGTAAQGRGGRRWR